VIRGREAWDERLEQTVAKLLDEIKPPAAGHGTSRPGPEKAELPEL
jgi:hypothetical protein